MECLQAIMEQRLWNDYAISPQNKKEVGEKVGGKSGNKTEGKFIALSISTIHIKKYTGMKKRHTIPCKNKMCKCKLRNHKITVSGKKKQPKQYK